MKLPRETAAFAAGLYQACRHWHVIAATLAQAGLGVFRPEEVEMAARDWLDEMTPPDRVMSAEEGVAATRPGKAS